MDILLEIILDIMAWSGDTKKDDLSPKQIKKLVSKFFFRAVVIVAVLVLSAYFIFFK